MSERDFVLAEANGAAQRASLWTRPGAGVVSALKSTCKFGLVSSISFAALALATGVAAAQDSGEEANAGSGSDEIVVVAQRREENLQDVPISIQALSSDMLEAANIDDAISLGLYIPGLEINASNGAATTYLRGIGTDNAVSGAESPVAYYVDGVYVASPAAALFTLNNVERVEVLRGPQGTLFGRNASGGVIQIITRAPDQDFGGEVSLGYGNYNTLEGSLYATAGVSDRLATDLAVSFRDQGDGYGDNPTLGTDVYATDNWAVRNTWLYRGDATDVRFSLSATETETDIGSRVVPAGNSILLAGETNQGGLTFFGGIPDQGANISTWDTALTINHRFDGFDLVSITSFQHAENQYIASADSSAAALLRIAADEFNDTFTQEFQLLGETQSGDWIAGFYYFTNDAGYDSFNTLLATPALISISNIAASQETNSYAVYGQLTQNLSDRLRGTLGLRYTLDEREFSGTNVVPTSGGPVVLTVPANNQSTDDDALTWRLALDYDFSDAIMGYVSYNRGFKSGQFAVNAFTTPPVDSEILDAFEVGLKSELFDHRLRLNVAAFYYDYQSLQSQVVVGTTPTIVNAGDAVIQGIDVDFNARLSDQFRVFGGVSILDSESQDYPNPPSFVPNNPSGPAPNGITLPLGPGGSLVQVGAPGSGNAPGTLLNARGNSLPLAPELTATLGASYTVETSSSGAFEFNANLAYNDGFFFEFENRAAQDAYTIFGASLNWTSPTERFGVSLWGANLTDEEYFTGGTSYAFGDFGFPAAPATYGVTLRAGF